MSVWLPIESAPTDGSEVMVKRVYQGRVVKEGLAVFALPHDDAPIRQPMEVDPLGRLSAEDYEREARDVADYNEQPRWLTPDRMFSFPAPTHWRP